MLVDGDQNVLCQFVELDLPRFQGPLEVFYLLVIFKKIDFMVFSFLCALSFSKLIGDAVGAGCART